MIKYLAVYIFFVFKYFRASEFDVSMPHPYLDTSPHPILRKIPLSMIWQTKDFLGNPESQIFGLMSFEVRSIRFNTQNFRYLSIRPSGLAKCKKRFAFVSQNPKWNSFAFGSEVHWNENIELDLLGWFIRTRFPNRLALVQTDGRSWRKFPPHSLLRPFDHCIRGRGEAAQWYEHLLWALLSAWFLREREVRWTDVWASRLRSISRVHPSLF